MDCEPRIGLSPDHAPEAVQLVAFVVDQVTVELPPLWIALGPTLRLTVGALVDAPTVTVVDCTAVPPVPLQVRVYVALDRSPPVDCEPASALTPSHEPLATQELAFADDQLSVAIDPFTTVLGSAEKLTVGTAGVTETTADCVALPPGPVQLSV